MRSPEEIATSLMEQYIEGDWEDLHPAIIKMLQERDAEWADLTSKEKEGNNE